ncbi:DUF1489 family protein [Aquabacter spiritensis]|uniref:DUF1489 family protein n=1 Tax=Aquabacter spiritensis TaxID=933073 RepID=A0A4R3LPW7_9HYPH|nr:DUF1489 domain-containing protein [Aquabacter spiritensis]TCT02440.1 hypothetical protein EDC64_11388 [Aquabacter spiritensis]
MNARAKAAKPSPRDLSVPPAGGLHLLKLCVGADSVEDLTAWIAARLAERAARGLPGDHAHVTRMMPTRATELLAGGSLYWVIKGEVLCRQRLRAIEPFVDGEGIGRCRLVLDPTVVRVVARPSRPFQGWRYLKGAEAPFDAAEGQADDRLPEAMQRELRALGLL